MIRFTLPALLVVCLAVEAPVRHATASAGELPISIGNRTEPNDDDLHVITKMFLVAMRNHHTDKNGNALRGYFDPRYLKKHNLTDRDLSVQMAAVWNIYNYVIADDRQTILCFVDTKENPNAKEPVKEAILLRIVLLEGKLYVSPVKAPDAKSGSFTPWILRTKF
jgi:hypothetical protein